MQNSVVFLLLFIVLRHFVALLHFNSYLLHFFALLATRGNPVHCAPQQRLFFTSAYKLLLHILCRLLLFFALFFFFLSFFRFTPRAFCACNMANAHLAAAPCISLVIYYLLFPFRSTCVHTYTNIYMYLYVCVCV